MIFFTGLIGVSTAAVVGFVIWQVFTERKRNATRFNARTERSVYSPREERVFELLAADLEIHPRKIYLDDELRATLGYDIDPFSSDDGFQDLFVILSPLQIDKDSLSKCKTVGDVVSVATLSEQTRQSY